MILIMGLGNPGKKYEKTRHNIGFRAIDEFAKENNFPDFKFEKLFAAEISKNSIFGNDIILAKPQTFMNNSGQSAKLLIKNWKIKNLIIIHDDIDLPIGKIKIVKNRGSAGHKGIDSVVKEIKSKNFARLRIGIQPKQGKPKNVETFVIKNFTKDEEKIINETIKKVFFAIKIFLSKGIEKSMNEFNNK